ncbi:MAG: peptidoglycan editing factor PgeF [Phycisphaerales bacterium]
MTPANAHAERAGGEPPAGRSAEPVLRRSALLEACGVPHAFCTRVGGVSSGVFASLNFGNPGELEPARRDAAENIRENTRRVLAAIGCVGREVVEVHQVHGANVHEVCRGRPAHAGEHDTRADAILSDDAARMLGIRTADCAPILLAGDDGRVVAAAHAGWRGTIDGVARNTVSAMRGRQGITRVIACIGPCIGPEHFEVGPEVAAAFARAGLLEAARARPSLGRTGHMLLDLQGALALQLREAGVEEVECIRECTFASPAHYFSHRRDAGVTGRMLSLIGSKR